MSNPFIVFGCIITICLVIGITVHGLWLLFEAKNKVSIVDSLLIGWLIAIVAFGYGLKSILSSFRIKIVVVEQSSVSQENKPADFSGCLSPSNKQELS